MEPIKLTLPAPVRSAPIVKLVDSPILNWLPIASPVLATDEPST